MLMLAGAATLSVALLAPAPASAEPAADTTDEIPKQGLDALGAPDTAETAPRPKLDEGDWPKRDVETLEEGYAWGPDSTWPTRPCVIPSDSSNSDGAYGRFKGRLEIGVGLGAEFSADTPLLTARLTLHYFSTAGVYAMYAANVTGSASEPVSASSPSTSSAPSRLSAGIDLRPLFLPRFALDYEQGPAFLDLTIDSFSLALGAFWQQQAPGESFGEVRGVEASIGGGLPLFGSATGFWIRFRGFGRWQTDVLEPTSAEWAGLVLLAWQQVLPI